MSLAHRHGTALFLAVALAAIGIAALRSFGTRRGPALTVDRSAGEVRLRAIVQPTAMDRPLGVKGHHAIVWDGGRAARWALFRSMASDREVRAALESLGARPGENLTPETWNRREDPHNTEPDKRVEGTPVEVFVAWDGSEGRIPIDTLIAEKGMGRPTFDFHYGGNQRWQPEFKSGCIVCLYSCPGGAIGNRSKTIRDSVREGIVYASLPERLPKRGSSVTIILRPRLEAK